jgi:hypothetical protein
MRPIIVIASRTNCKNRARSVVTLVIPAFTIRQPQRNGEGSVVPSDEDAVWSAALSDGGSSCSPSGHAPNRDTRHLAGAAKKEGGKLLER